MDTQYLDRIMELACTDLILPFPPDFYSLRHRYRTDMLGLDVPFHILNYLAGHESLGIESMNIYLERSIQNITAIYSNAARRIAARYEVF